MSGRNLINMDTSTTNVYLNRDPIEATLPVQAIQTTVNDPIIISLKGLSGIGASNANKIIKVNSAGDALEYGVDDASNWVLSGSNLYPLATSTNVLIGSTTNTNSSKFFVNGTSEFNNDVVINNGSAESRLLIGTNSFSGNGSLVVYNPTGAGLVIFSPTQGQANSISLRGTNNTNSDEARITFDPMVGLAEETYLRFQYADKYFFDKQIIIDTTGAELSNGTNTYTLPTSNGTIALTSDVVGYWELPVFGSNALVPNNVNYFIQLQKQTDSTFETLLEFENINSGTDIQYFRFSINDNGTTSELKFDSERNSTITNVYEITNEGYMTFNKGIEIKDTNFQFTAPNGDNFNFPTSTPKNGILATRGDVIAYNFGGTGLTSLTPNKILQINSNGNGFNMVDLPASTSSQWTLVSNNLYPNSTGTNVLIGTTSNASNRDLLVNGTAEINSTLHVDSIELKNTNNSYNLEMRDDRIRNKSYVLNAHIFQTITGLSYPIHILQSGTSTSTKTFNILLANQDSEWDGGGYANNTKFPLLGNDDGNFFLHLNTIGDAYQISGTNSSNLQHLFLGKTVINKELVANVDNASSNGRIGFQNFLAGYPNNIFPTLIAEQTYGYFMSATTPISGTGGSYDGYWGNGAIGNASDRRLKKNINTIENPIDIIKKLRGVNFEWICENKPKGTQIGYIAQEVNEVIPSICDFLPTKNECCEDGTWGIQPANISAILVEGIKAQQEEINTLKTELDTYKSLMNKLINAKSFADFKKNIA